jgi:hypothetical protein
MKNTERKKFLSAVQLGLIGLMLMPSGVPVMAAAPGTVVINEVAWAGSTDSANDEWLELYNTTSAAVDLSNWKLRDDGVDAFTFPVGSSIAARGYLLMEDSEGVTNLPADLIFNMSLANTGDSLQLVDAAGVVIDTVNRSGGAWYAGSSTTFASMERKDAAAGDLALNFAASTGAGVQTGVGAAIIGTPKTLNSASTVQAGTAQIKAEFSPVSGQINQVVKLQVKAENLTDLFAYGYELNYDATLLEYQGVVPGTFLSDSGLVTTSFQAGLKGGELGKLLVAEARTIDPKIGRNGSGLLFEVNFKVKVESPTGATVSFAAGSFSSSPSADLSVVLVPATLNTAPTVIAPVTGLAIVEGVGRYQLKLSWTASTSAPDHYRVERKNSHGQWTVLAGVNALEFVDQDAVNGGGALIPDLIYNYRVTAVKAALTSTAVEISGQDSRGVKGDNNRTDLVDGRDLERLAKQFAATDLIAGFDPLIDTTYDGVINGSDLIDIGATFAQKY